MFWRRLVLLIVGATLGVLGAWAEETSGLWWDVYWYPTQQQGWFCPDDVQLNRSRLLGQERFPLVFVRDWGEGVVYAGEKDYIGFEALLTIELPYPMELEFVIGVDDGAALYIDGKEVINLWQCGRIRERRVSLRLRAGKHTLELRFFEWRGRAYIKFDIVGPDNLELAIKLARLGEELAEFEKRVQEELAGLRRDLETLRETVAKLEARMSTTERNLEESIAALKAQLREIEKRVESREQTIKGQIAAVEGALAALKDAVTRIEVLASKTDRKLEESLAALKAQLEEMEERFGAREQTIREQIAIIEGALDALRDDVEKLGARVSIIEPNLAVLKAQLAEIEERFGFLEQTMKEQIAAIEGALAALRDDVDALERGLSTVAEKHDALEAEIQALEERVSAMEKTLGESTSGWEVHWYEMVQPGVFGAKLGTSSFPLNFAFDWGYGRVYKLWDRVGFKAYARVYLAEDAWHYIKVAANNCFVLYIDGNKVLDHWGVGEALPAEEKELEIWLSAGWHELELHYYEWEEQAWVSFYLK